MPENERAKRIVRAIYSGAAERLYEPLVVQGAFRLFGGRLNELAFEQGRRAVAVAGGRPILDMPVGTAYFTLEMARAFDGLVVGTDIADGMVKRAHETGRAAGLTNLAVVQADAHRLPFATGTFGAIMCTNGLQVIPGLEPTVAELARVLADDGTLLVSVITLPAPRPPRSKRRRRNLPTVMLSGDEIAAALEEVGLMVQDLATERLATLIEARKPRLPVRASESL
jgi:SAM-dependent methyltransferase